MDEVENDSWWVVSGTTLRSALKRAHDGEDPELLYVELWANAEHERPGHDQERE